MAFVQVAEDTSRDDWNGIVFDVDQCNISWNIMRYLNQIAPDSNVNTQTLFFIYYFAALALRVERRKTDKIPRLNVCNRKKPK